MSKRILITGGSGFIGTNIIDFYKENHDILNIDIKEPRNKSQIKYWVNCNILDEEYLVETFLKFKPQYVFHMAARTDLEGKNLNDYNANIEGVKNIINAISKTSSIKKAVFASTRLVCEIGYNPKNEYDYKPSTIYGESKIIGEKIVRESKELNTKWIIVRPTSLWGPWFGVPYKNFFNSVYNKVYYHPKGMKIHKKFGFVLNCVYILDKLLENTSLNKSTVYLSDFKELEVHEWADLISQNFHDRDIKEVPFFILKGLSIIGDLLKKAGYKNPPLTTFRLNNLITPMPFETSNVEDVVGELPYNTKIATTITCKWLIDSK